MKHKKIWIPLIIVVLIVSLIVLVMSRATTTSTTYAVENVTKGDITMVASASGSINPDNIYSLSARTSAKVLEVDVKTGDKVTAGQQLAKLDDTDLQSAVKTAMYNFNAAVYARNKLQAQTVPPVDSNSISQSQQQVNVASVQLSTAKRNLSNAVITSPVAGEVLSVGIKVGDYASLTGLQPTFTVADTSQLFAFLSVNEIDVNKVQVGQPVALTIDALGGNIINGTVAKVEDSGTNVAGIIYYTAKVSIPVQTGLKANMTVDGDITVASKSGVLTIPASALTQTQDSSTVKVASYDAKGNLIPVTRTVQVGINNNSIVEITSGLSETDKVVIESSGKVSGFGFSLVGSSTTTPTP